MFPESILSGKTGVVEAISFWNNSGSMPESFYNSRIDMLYDSDPEELEVVDSLTELTLFCPAEKIRETGGLILSPNRKSSGGFGGRWTLSSGKRLGL